MVSQKKVDADGLLNDLIQVKSSLLSENFAILEKKESRLLITIFDEIIGDIMGDVIVDGYAMEPYRKEKEAKGREKS